MPVMLNSRVSAVILSRGSTWNPQPWEPPYTLPDTGNAWPTATAQCVFYDTSGTTLATVTGTVTAGGIAFNAAPAVVDLIPNGANFELFMTVAGAPYQIRYGKVIRKEVQFTTAPESVTSPLEFTDSWPTTGLRSTWVTLSGGVVVYNNSGAALLNGVGVPNQAGGAWGAMRWFKPLATDTVSVKVSLLNQNSYVAGTYAQARVVLSADAAFSSFLAVEFKALADGAGVHSDVINLCTGAGPVTVAYQGSPISNVVADGDAYTIRYDDATKGLSVYKGASASPLGTWTDAGHVVPHGPGYRYVGLSFTDTGLTDGVQVTSWQAIDRL